MSTKNNEKTDGQKIVQRITASPEKGLTAKQAEKRKKDGLNNYDTQPKGKSVKRILYDNIVTLFNILNLLLGIAVFVVGSYKNMLFLGVMFFNTIIGIIQELRAKSAIEKLSIVSATKAVVIRDGAKQSVSTEDIVLDDIIQFSQGNQIPVDSVIVSGECEVNESLLTGESDAIIKRSGDMVLSGSYVVSGKCTARVEHVAADNYASKISAEAKYTKQVNSEIMITLRNIVRFLTFIILPLAGMQFIHQINRITDHQQTVSTLFGEMSAELQRVVVATVASTTSIIPEGLMLLTSTVLAVAVIRLSQHKVLVQELYCIETLARVDVLCLDKTGTITEGCMEVADIVPYGDSEKENVEDALTELASALEDTNATFMAIKDHCKEKGNMKADTVIPFSSEKKWSGAHFEGGGAYIMGAAEFILKEVPADLKNMLAEYSKNYRAIIVAHSDGSFNGKDLPDDISVIGIALINDKIRPEAPRTLRYFADQGVEVKIISGDNPITVSNVAKRAGVKNAESFVDAATLTTDELIEDAMKKYTVFGRVTPAQKKKFVIALKKQGHTVAMTGDGVNDVLALKEADCSIAMAEGSDAARNVSQLVLLDSNFASMPKVVLEGRRNINNIQRSAALYIVKTVFSVLLAIFFIFVSASYPFQPIQYTLINAFTIGIPSFILALEPNKERIKGIFIFNILRSSVPAGLTITIGIMICVIAQKLFGMSELDYTTLCVLSLTAGSMMILFKISRPFNVIRTVLFILMNAGMIIGITVFRWFFVFSELNLYIILNFCGIFVLELGIFILLTFIVEKYTPALEKKFIQAKLRKITLNAEKHKK